MPLCRLLYLSSAASELQLERKCLFDSVFLGILGRKTCFPMIYSAFSSSFLRPGLGLLWTAASGGAEAAVHASRRFLQTMDTDLIFVKLDISNAFNSLCRVHMMSAVNSLIPEIAPYCHLAYAEKSQLQYESFTIQSEI